MQRSDLTGIVFNRLTVKAYAFARCGKTYWTCDCSCGNSNVVSASNLKSNHVTSCGCFQKEEQSKRITKINTVHGHNAKKPSRTYNSWQSMHNRCKKPKHRSFYRYGGRGISVCERWNSFVLFLADMGERPEGKTLDRKDPNGNYQPDNCKWATPTEQQRNRADNYRRWQ